MIARPAKRAARDGAPAGPLAAVMRRLRASEAGEHEIALNRVALATCVLIYLLAETALYGDPLGEAFLITAAFFLGGLGFVAHLAWRPAASLPRRVLAITFDLTGISYCMHVGGETTAILYPIYLWVIFGNGFRFGLRMLAIGAAIAIAGFSVVIVTTPYWGDHLRLSFGLLAGLLILPAYAATLIRKLSNAKSAAEDASRAKSLFLASVSHELRTPLNAVIGMTDLLDGTTLDDEQRDMTRTAGDAGRTLLRLIDDLLNFSRIEAGRMPSRAVDFDLHGVLAEVRGMLTAQARDKRLRLALHVTPRTPYRLKGEERQLKDVLVNLVGNAVKFTEVGGVTIAVDAISRDERGVRLRFEVADTGIGIAPEARARIFETFTQADASIINSHGGTGLGLAISKQMIELQGGSIGVESEVGAGSVFWFEINLALASDKGAELAPRAGHVVAVATDQGRAAKLAAALAQAGVSADACGGVRDAVRALREHERAGRRRAAVIDGRGADAEAIATALRAGLDGDDLETVIIDGRFGEGLPPLDLRFVCASAARDLPAPTGLAAMVRIATIGVAGDPRPRSVAPDVVPTRRLSVLVAEDNRVNQKVIRKVLERAGHEARIVDNGELALDALAERTFDIVLMDVNMPVLDGVECTKLFRFASIGKPRTPVIALTADATPEARRRCEEAGMDACVTKPIEPAQLLALIAEMAGEGPGEAVAEAEALVEPPHDDETVARLARHPGFRPARRTVVDRRTLTELEQLGGRAFVGDLVDEFLVDAEIVLQALRQAVEDRDTAAFREQAHALRSGAANIGARGMYELCLSWRNIEARDLAVRGHTHIQRLEAEFRLVGKALRELFPKRGRANGG
ncbi:ATP-binding protein [Methylopila sp. Yamaguchi]|uniref:ATP-binding protein n=1 Tax=Methylopila sp. Yamaguchi TaxID=1437817 RepID=UPI000CBD1470|nr:ATP-binding protein [Methylopila sp. Yamaguchi]GBD48196.1 signal transduction histidine kinase [Methylopila sp. Yamaguchi]